MRNINTNIFQDSRKTLAIAKLIMKDEHTPLHHGVNAHSDPLFDTEMWPITDK